MKITFKLNTQKPIIEVMKIVKNVVEKDTSYKMKIEINKLIPKNTSFWAEKLVFEFIQEERFITVNCIYNEAINLYIGKLVLVISFTFFSIVLI